MSHQKTAFWWVENRKHPFALFLYPLSLIYGALWLARLFAYRIGLVSNHRLPGFTLSIGNITVGGAGKSPLVIAICKLYQELGLKPVIVTRGYGSRMKSRQFMTILDGKVLTSNFSAAVLPPDEAMMQSMTLRDVPVIAGVRRYDAVKAALPAIKSVLGGNAKLVFVLDDGFQHWRIRRDFDLVVVNVKNRFGNRLLLPAGPLREPLRALKRASLLVERCDDQNPVVGKVVRDSIVLHYKQLSPLPLVDYLSSIQNNKSQTQTLNNQDKILVVSGIANPAALSTSLRNHGFVEQLHYFVGDHDAFDRVALMERLQHVSAVVTTPKDYWRNPDIFIGLPIQVWIVDIVPDINPIKSQLIAAANAYRGDIA